ncbi:hypothetical protein [Streptomyces sennicomposti]
MPPEHKGRVRRGVARRTLLIGGFQAGPWTLTDEASVVEPFGETGAARWAEIAAEAERMPAVLPPGRARDIRVGDVAGR